MIEEDEGMIATKLFDSISHAVKFNKVNLQKELNNFNQCISSLINKLISKKDEFIYSIAKLEQKYDEINLKIGKHNSKSFSEAMKLNNAFCAVNAEYSSFKENKQKLFEEIIEILKSTKITDEIVQVVDKNEEKINLIDCGNGSPDENATVSVNMNEKKKEAAEIKNDENEEALDKIPKSISSQDYNDNTHPNQTDQTNFKCDEYFIGRKRSLNKIEIGNVEEVVNYKSNCSEESNSLLNLNKKYKNKKRRLNCNDFKNNFSNSYLNSTPLCYTDAEVAEKLKIMFPFYNFNMLPMVRLLKNKIVKTFEFDVLSISKVKSELKEFLKEEEKRNDVGICSTKKPLFILLKICTKEPGNCTSNSTLFIRIKDLFSKRCTTFLEKELIVGGLPNFTHNINSIFYEISKDSFMNYYNISLIKISLYNFFEDIMKKVENTNEKLMIHNIDKNEFTKYKEQQQVLKKLREGYKEIMKKKSP